MGLYDDKHTHEIYDRQTNGVISTHASLPRARNKVDKLDNEYGGYRYGVRPIARTKEEMTQGQRNLVPLRSNADKGD